MRALSKNRLREIKKNPGRYFAIMSIIALGVGFFSGLQITNQAMLETCQSYVSQSNMYDFKLISTLGMTKEDESALSSLEYIGSAVGAYSADVLCTVDDGEETALKLHSITPGIDIPLLTRGRMPLSDRECVADSRLFTADSIGSSIKISSSNEEDTLDMLKYDEYKIVGLVRSVNYMNLERGSTKLGSGKLAGFVYLTLGGFKSEYFTEMYLDAGLPGSVYSEEYKAAAEEMTDAVTDALKHRGDIRFESIVAEANEELDEHRLEYDDGLREYEEEKEKAEQELADAQRKIDEGAGKLYSGMDKLYNNSPKLGELHGQLAQVEAGIAAAGEALVQLEGQKATALAGLEQIAAGCAELEAYIAEASSAVAIAQQSVAGLEAQLLDPTLTPEQEAELEEQLGIAIAAEAVAVAMEAELNSQLAALNTQEAELQAGLGQLEAGIAQANETISTLNGQKAQIETGIMDILIAREEIEINSAKLWEAQNELEEGRVEAEEKLADAEKKLEDAKQELLDAEKKIADIEPPDTYVLTREENVGYVCFENDSAIVAGIAKVFPLFFFMVAALVCMTTMTRMIVEQRTQIGALKALGYSDADVMWGYIQYSGSSAFIGAVLGYLIGTKLFPFVIWVAYGIIYGFAEIVYAVNLPLALVSLAAALLCSVGTTWLVCRKELNSMPAELMRPKTPKAGKRILLEYVGFIWNALGFLHKVSLRNIFRYRGRLIMMLLGVGGCTALVLTGLGIRDSISDIADYQYNDIMKYDYAIVFNEALSDEDISDFKRELGSELMHPSFVCQVSAKAPTPKGNKELNIIASNEEDIPKLFDLHTEQHEPIPYPADGELVLSDKLAELMELELGDEVTLELDDVGMNTLTLRLSGICQNHVYNYAYMTLDSYESSGLSPEIKHAYAISSDKSRLYDVSAELMGGEKVLSVSVTQDMRDRISRMMNSMNYVVALVIASAAALAFIVLINLSNINIIERQREIATIKVLGFYSGETSSYVFRENLVLTVLGSLLGLPLGVLLHGFVMSQISIDMVSFDTIIRTPSYVIAVVLTIVFAMLVNLLLRRKLDRIDMAESLKSVE